MTTSYSGFRDEIGAVTWITAVCGQGRTFLNNLSAEGASDGALSLQVGSAEMIRKKDRSSARGRRGCAWIRLLVERRLCRLLQPGQDAIRIQAHTVFASVVQMIERQRHAPRAFG